MSSPGIEGVLDFLHAFNMATVQYVQHMTVLVGRSQGIQWQGNAMARDRASSTRRQRAPQGSRQTEKAPAPVKAQAESALERPAQAPPAASGGGDGLMTQIER